jgi:hypothetical protein
MKNFSIKPIGFIRSELRRREEAPRQSFEGAPNALIEVLPPYRKALDRMQVGGEIIVITWLHRAKRDVLKVRPRGDRSRPLTGVFSTRIARSSQSFGTSPRESYADTFRSSIGRPDRGNRRDSGCRHKASGQLVRQLTAYAMSRKTGQ